ncbi:hypothetical protein [Vagococcus lutrae]|uniref:hypothetical protein n=1 Tax=Vagococcus lutrae TaxID=81947 RepID=UPI00200ECCE1|nr:hypothetical protein [Vagococcus lutrae]MDT2806525.1 hypothetical protein [Vagococcus lutrae]MDT2824973.1 hypothetical protein [Vagococcus lutrae]UQF18124.1 hypothetical protein M2905_05445 [Vagococcus lutrae]
MNQTLIEIKESDMRRFYSVYLAHLNRSLLTRLKLAGSGFLIVSILIALFLPTFFPLAIITIILSAICFYFQQRIVPHTLEKQRTTLLDSLFLGVFDFNIQDQTLIFTHARYQRIWRVDDLEKCVVTPEHIALFPKEDKIMLVSKLQLNTEARHNLTKVLTNCPTTSLN